MKDDLVPTVDPIQGSLEHLVAICFAKSTSVNYGLAVNVAQGADVYQETTIAKQKVHMALFGRTPEQAGRARTVLQYLSGIKSLQVFAGGSLVKNFWRLCMLKSVASFRKNYARTSTNCWNGQLYIIS